MTELSAGAELDGEVAKALGWKHEKGKHGLMSWISPEGLQFATPPAYSTDLNVAITLLGKRLTSIHVMPELHASCMFHLGTFEPLGSAPSLAVAICNCFLDMVAKRPPVPEHRGDDPG